MPEREWIRVSEAAERLGVNPSTVRRRANRGELAVRFGPSGRMEICLDLDPAHAPQEREESTEPTDAAKANNPYIKALNEQDPQDEATRLQKLAGASMILAQQRADEANEKLATVRFELRRSRKHQRYAIIAAGLSLSLCLFALFSRPGGPQAATASPGSASGDAQALQSQVELLKQQLEQAQAQQESWIQRAARAEYQLPTASDEMTSTSSTSY